jgi:hypothetical protein
MSAEPASPEGVAVDATLDFGMASPADADMVVNVGADSTAAFSEWAMGAAAHEGGAVDMPCLTGPLATIAEGLEPVGDGGSSADGSPEPTLAPAAGAVTPSRELTPPLRRRSGHVSSVEVEPTPVRAPRSLPSPDLPVRGLHCRA